MTDPPADGADDLTDAPTDGGDAVEPTAITTPYKVLGQFDADGGVGVLGQNDADSGTPIGVQGAVPNADGYGLATPDDARIQGGMNTTGDWQVTVDGDRALLLGNAGGAGGGYGGNVVHGNSANGVVDDARAATIGGGGYSLLSTNDGNVVYDDFGTVAGGAANVVGSPDGDRTSDVYATVGGGSNNQARAGFATIAGGEANLVSDGDTHATVGGGQSNVVEGILATVGGGVDNTASDNFATVDGGDSNTASDRWATVGGGRGNTASGEDATVSGGGANTASGTNAIVGGGDTNDAFGDDSTIGGGASNRTGTSGTSEGRYATVGGGSQNAATGSASTVGGGLFNDAFGDESTIGGGQGNVASGDNATVCGGHDNTARGNEATVSGGSSNYATGGDATVAGGRHNAALGPSSTIGGGSSNRTGRSGSLLGGWATVPGGVNNIAEGSKSFAAGEDARATGDNAFVWNDGASGTVTAAWSNSFVVHASNGVGLNTTEPVSQLHVRDDVAEGGSSNLGRHVVAIENTNDGTGSHTPDALGIRMTNLDQPGTSNNFISFLDADDGTIGSIQGDGGGGVEFTGTTADFAEYFPKADPDREFAEGEVVGLRDGEVVPASEGVDATLVVSTAPIVTGNRPIDEDDREDFVALSLVGQVPVKVDGPVESGDRLVASPDACGTATARRRCDADRPVVGIALGDASGEESPGTDSDGTGDSTRQDPEVLALVGTPGGAALRDRTASTVGRPPAAVDESGATLAGRDDQTDAQQERIEALDRRLAAIDDQSDRIDRLEAANDRKDERIEHLEAENDRLRDRVAAVEAHLRFAGGGATDARSDD